MKNIPYFGNLSQFVNFIGPHQNWPRLFNSSLPFFLIKKKLSHIIPYEFHMEVKCLLATPVPSHSLPSPLSTLPPITLLSSPHRGLGTDKTTGWKVQNYAGCWLLVVYLKCLPSPKLTTPLPFRDWTNLLWLSHEDPSRSSMYIVRDVSSEIRWLSTRSKIHIPFLGLSSLICKTRFERVPYLKDDEG